MTATPLGRRQWLTRAGLMGGLGALWSTGVLQAEDRDDDNRADLVIDVAGVTIRSLFPGPPYTQPPVQSTPPPEFGGTDSRGASGFAEGLIYPGGTIQAPAGFDPHGTRATGHYFARGWFLSNLERPKPHLVTTQEYLFGLITPERPSPVDTLVSSGVDGGIEIAHRAVIGGSGRYRYARGDVRQQFIGINALGAPNFRFWFRF